MESIHNPTAQSGFSPWAHNFAEDMVSPFVYISINSFPVTKD